MDQRIASTSSQTRSVSGLGCKTTTAKLAAPVAASTLNSLDEEDRTLLSTALEEPAEYMDNPVFRKSNAEKLLFGDGDNGQSPAPEAGLPLTASDEVRLFQQFNYARCRQYRIIKQHRGKRLRQAAIRDLLAWRRRAEQTRTRIVQLNVSLVLAMAKRTRLSRVDFADLISEGNMALLRCADKFDCGRGFKFSTYACRSIIKSFSRVAMRTARHRAKFGVEYDPAWQKSDHLERQRQTVEQDCVAELRSILAGNAAELTDIERKVMGARFALDAPAGPAKAAPRTLAQVGAEVGLTKERVRQIQNSALRKLRAVLEDRVLAA